MYPSWAKHDATGRRRSSHAHWPRKRDSDIPQPLYQVPVPLSRYLAHGSARVRSVHMLDNLPIARTGIRKRSRVGASRTHSRADGMEEVSDTSAVERFSKRVLIVVESEGAVFDTTRPNPSPLVAAFPGVILGSGFESCSSEIRARPSCILFFACALNRWAIIPRSLTGCGTYCRA